MKKLIKNLYLILPILFLLPAFSQTQVIQVKVVGVIDGDTITVLLKDKSQKQVRIKGIDAPELPQAFGTEARQKLSDLILNKIIVIEYLKFKPDGQILGNVFLNGKDVGLEMIQTGFAWLDDEQEELLNSNNRSRYESSETNARSQSIGLWQDQAPIPPWEFKKNYVPPVLAGKPSVNSSTVFEAQVMEVIDGATIALKMANNSRIVICISRLETPEPGQPKADVAEQHLKDLLIQKNVRVSVFGFTEDENCIAGDVYLNNININLQMIRDGVAWANKSYYYPEGYYTYEAAQQAARNEKRGIWEDLSPTPPWEYRAAFYKEVEGSSSDFGYGSGGYSSGGGGDYSSSGDNKTVRVRAYTRSDGTYVRSYMRSAPGSGSSRSSGGRKH